MELNYLPFVLGGLGGAVGYAIGGREGAVFGSCVGFFLGQTVRSLRRTFV